MKFLFKYKPWQVFILSFLAISIPLCVFPINLFPGIIEFKQANFTQEAPLSLSYFIGLGYDPKDLESLEITNFYLTKQGYFLAVIFLLGIPGLLAYGSYLYKK